jgi:hypothetical protein
MDEGSIGFTLSFVQLQVQFIIYFSLFIPAVLFEILEEALYGAVSTQLVSFCKCLFLTCQLDYMFRPLYNLGHHHVLQLLVLFTCNANYD